MAALTRKQQAFVDEYLIDLNATQAAIRAGYSEKTASEIGAENLGKPLIARAIQSALDERAERTGVTQDRVIAELAAIAFSDLTDFATWNEDSVSLINSSDLDEEAVKALREVVATTTTYSGERGDSTTTRMHVRQHDKLKALELLGRHLGMFKKDVDVNVTVGITIEKLIGLAADGNDG